MTFFDVAPYGHRPEALFTANQHRLFRYFHRAVGVTGIVKMPGRGHALTIDAGWREVADKALDFVKRFT